MLLVSYFSAVWSAVPFVFLKMALFVIVKKNAVPQTSSVLGFALRVSYFNRVFFSFAFISYFFGHRKVPCFKNCRSS